MYLVELIHNFGFPVLGVGVAAYDFEEGAPHHQPRNNVGCKKGAARHAKLFKIHLVQYEIQRPPTCCLKRCVCVCQGWLQRHSERERERDRASARRRMRSRKKDE